MEQIKRMTIGEIAEVAGTPRPTVKDWVKRWEDDPFDHLAGRSWRRFDLGSTVRVIVQAEALKICGNAAIASRVGFYTGECILDFQGERQSVRRNGLLAGVYLVVTRTSSGGYHHAPALNEAQLQHWLETAVELSSEAAAAGFQVFNVGTLADVALGRVFDFQGISGEEARA